MIRTFIAIEVPERIRGGLADGIRSLRAGAPLVKWAKPENLHLTLRFLGDVKEDDLEELFDALAAEASALSPFVMEIVGVGAFPNWRHPRVVWAGCGEGAEEAVGLAGAVEAACVRLGYEREKRPFRPHLTLGRVKQPADAAGLEGAVAGLEAKPFGFLDADAITVFMSDLRRTGPVYAPMARFELG